MGLNIQSFERAGQAKPGVEQLAGIAVYDSQAKFPHCRSQAGRMICQPLDLG